MKHAMLKSMFLQDVVVHQDEIEQRRSDDIVSYIWSAQERWCDVGIETQQRRGGNSLETESRRSAAEVKKREKKSDHERVKAGRLVPQERIQQYVATHQRAELHEWNGIRNLYSEEVKVLQA